MKYESISEHKLGEVWLLNTGGTFPLRGFTDGMGSVLAFDGAAELQGGFLLLKPVLKVCLDVCVWVYLRGAPQLPKCRPWPRIWNKVIIPRRASSQSLRFFICPLPLLFAFYFSCQMYLFSRAPYFLPPLFSCLLLFKDSGKLQKA